MLNFFSKIIKQKKIIVLIFLSVVIFSVFTPIHQLKAFSAGYGGMGYDSAPYEGYGEKNEGWLEGVAKDLFNALLRGVATIVITITGALMALSAELLGWVIAETSKVLITSSSVVTTGWASARNLANMVVVLGFIIIGVATALRFKEYEAKRLLGKLIIAALLINFSILICGIAIDASNITTKYFLQHQGGALAGSFSEKITGQLSEIKPDASSTAVFFEIVKYVFFNIVAFFIFILFAFLFLFRIVALMILVILSPLAFVLAVFPGTNRFYEMWKNNFIQWCIIAIPASFFLYLSDVLIKEDKTGPNPSSGVDMFSVLIPGFFLIAGFVISLQTSAMGAGMAIKGFNSTKKGITSVAGKAGGAVGGALGASRAGKNIKNATTAVGERLGLVSKGTTALNKQKELENARKGIDAIQDNDRVAKIASGPAFTHKQQLEKAAAAETLMKRKAFDKIDPVKQDAVAAHAVAMGISKDTFTKGSPSLLTSSAPSALTGEPKSVTQNALFEKAKANSITSGATVETELGKLRKSKYNPTKAENNAARLRVEAQKQTENALGLSSLTDSDVKNKLIEEDMQGRIDAGESRSEAIRGSQKYGKTLTIDQIASRRGSLGTERINKGFAKMSAQKIEELSPSVLSSPEFTENVGYEALSRFLSQNASADQVEKIQSSIPTLKESREKLLGFTPKSSTSAQRKAKMAALKSSTNTKDRETYKKARALLDKINLIK